MTQSCGELIEQASSAPRLWFYTNYHCNLTCGYCLTGSSPRAPRRSSSPSAILRLADEAVNARLHLLRHLRRRAVPEPLAARASRSSSRGGCPLVLLTNGTLFTRAAAAARRARSPSTPIEVQISLDSADPVENDAMRGPENYAKVVAAIPRLVDARHHRARRDDARRRAPTTSCRGCASCTARSASTTTITSCGRSSPAAGRVERGSGIAAGQPELFPELTLTADGAFWSPFGADRPAGADLDTELLLTRQIEPLERPLERLVGQLRGRPPGTDANLGIR